MNKIILAMLFLAVLLCFVQTTQPHPSKNSDAIPMIAKGKDQLIDGDIAVRLHNSPASAIIRDFNRVDKSYSHGGIVHIGNGCAMVYISTPVPSLKRPLAKYNCAFTLNMVNVKIN
jgi:hypothetical protein